MPTNEALAVLMKLTYRSGGAEQQEFCGNGLCKYVMSSSPAPAAVAPAASLAAGSAATTAALPAASAIWSDPWAGAAGASGTSASFLPTS